MRLRCTVQPDLLCVATSFAREFLKDMELTSDECRSMNSFSTLAEWSMGPKGKHPYRGSLNTRIQSYCRVTVFFFWCPAQVGALSGTPLLFHKQMTSMPGESSLTSSDAPSDYTDISCF